MQPISDSLAEGMTLAGETNQRLNQLRRDYYKPSIPPHLKSLCDKAKETESELFGDNLEEKLKVIKGENSLREEFKKKPATSTFKSPNPKKENRYSPYEKKDKPWISSNYKASQKSRGGQSGQSSNPNHQNQQKKSDNPKKKKYSSHKN